jgi:DNA-binding GntR family transcriptional regulator
VTALGSAAKLPRQTLAMATLEALRAMILRGELQQGDLLRQDALAARLGVSRIPVREALRQLEAEGLVSMVPHRGATVAMLPPGEILELYEIRALLEPEVLRLAIPNLAETDLAAAERILEVYDAALAAGAKVHSWGQYNLDFHETLYRPSRRAQSLTIIRNLHHKTDLYTRLQLLVPGGYLRERAREEHHAILDACRARDAERACAALAAHIREAGRSLVAFLTRQKD